MKSTEVLIIVVVAAAAVYVITRPKAPARQYIPGSASIGAYGVQTHVPVAAAGVALGSILGGAVSSWFGGGSSSNATIAMDRNTPASLGNTTVYNPVYPSTSILPYSYKQQVIDTPTLLSTDSVFTPPSNLYGNLIGGAGSSGSYADQGTGSDTSLQGTTTYFGSDSSAGTTTTFG